MSITTLETIIMKGSVINRIEMNSKGTPEEGTRHDPGPIESWEWVCNYCDEICTNLTLEEAKAQAEEHVCPKREAL